MKIFVTHFDIQDFSLLPSQQEQYLNMHYHSFCFIVLYMRNIFATMYM